MTGCNRAIMEGISDRWQIQPLVTYRPSFRSKLSNFYAINAYVVRKPSKLNLKCSTTALQVYLDWLPAYLACRYDRRSREAGYQSIENFGYYYLEPGTYCIVSGHYRIIIGSPESQRPYDSLGSIMTVLCKPCTLFSFGKCGRR
jgi:hypothetical protein